MKPVYQTIFTHPGGDCVRASLASIFNLDLDNVPDFANMPMDDWWTPLQEWCIQFDVYPIYIPYHKSISRRIKGYHLIFGLTKNKIPHAVVGHNGVEFHNPASKEAESDMSKIEEIEGIVLFISMMEKPNVNTSKCNSNGSFNAG